MKRICKTCGKVYVTDTGSFKCNSCLKFQNFKQKHSNEKPNVLPNEIHFSFNRSWTNEIIEKHDHVKINGTHEVDKKNKNHYSIIICLYNLNPFNLKHICTVISEENLHHAITEAMDSKTSKKADKSGLMQKLIEKGYL
jgi:hypothetical protein